MNKAEKVSVFDFFSDAKITGLVVNFKENGDFGTNDQVRRFEKVMREAGHEVKNFGLQQIDGGPSESDSVYGYQINVTFKRKVKFSEANARKVVKWFSGYKFYGQPRIEYEIQKHDKTLPRNVSATTMKSLREKLDYIAKREIW